MTIELWVAVLVAAVFVLYVVLKVVALNRQSRRDWEQTDKSRLREIRDEEDG